MSTISALLNILNVLLCDDTTVHVSVDLQVVQDEGNVAVLAELLFTCDHSVPAVLQIGTSVSVQILSM